MQLIDVQYNARKQNPERNVATGVFHHSSAVQKDESNTSKTERSRVTVPRS